MQQNYAPNIKFPQIFIDGCHTPVHSAGVIHLPMKRITVPVDTKIADSLAELSKENMRSTGAEAAMILRDFFAARESAALPPCKPRTRKVVAA